MNSNQVFELLWAQTWQVTVLATAVWGLVRLCGRDRPHLAHCLWSLVLLKCLIPPVWTSPIGLFCWLDVQANQLSSVPWFTQSTTAPLQSGTESETSSDVTIRVFDAFDAVAARENISEHATSRASNSQSRASATEYVKHWALTTWLVGCVASFSIAFLRLGLFWRFVRRSTLPHRQDDCPPNMDQLVQRLSERLRVGRRVRVAVLDATVGPAVYGLVRPTILLPAGIVRDRTLQELEPLLAHELIHIRRGDLWWALVQTLACSLFWFHPLVWLAHAMLSREAERSCDEETIAGLRCSPATYARSLLDVLESKQRLRVAPALPGVRPADVTRNRLERIMRLGHGSHASTPVWIWLLFVSSVVIVLPGGSWLSAQESPPDTSKQTVTQETSNSASLPLVPPATGTWVASWVNEKIDVSDLLDKLESQHGDREVARGMLLSMLPQRSIYSRNAEGNVKLSFVPAFSLDGNTLHLFETRSQIAICKKTIEELRRYGFDSVRMELKLIAIKGEELVALGLTWENAEEPSSDMMAKAKQLPWPEERLGNRSLPPPVPATFHPVQPVSAVADSAQPVPVKVVIATSGNITLGQFDTKVQDQLQADSQLHGQAISDPEVAGWLTIDQSPSSDTVKTHCAVVDTEKATAISALAERGEKRSILIAPKITCGNGSYAQVISYSPWSIKPRIASFDRPAPNQPLPELGFSGFSMLASPLIVTDSDNDGTTRIDLSLVCETHEVTRLDEFTFRGRQTANSANIDSATAVATTIVQPNVEWKKLAVRHRLRAGESLLISSREPLAPESDNKVLVIVATCEVLPAGTTQNADGKTVKSNVQRPNSPTERLSILGVTTSGDEVQKLPALSIDEVLTAWRKSNPDDKVLGGLDSAKLRMTETCIGDFVDAKKFVSQIGSDAILHHRLYKCELYQPTNSDKSDPRANWMGSIVVDHNHFHVEDANAKQ